MCEPALCPGETLHLKLQASMQKHDAVEERFAVGLPLPRLGTTLTALKSILLECTQSCTHMLSS